MVQMALFYQHSAPWLAGVFERHPATFDCSSGPFWPVKMKCSNWLLIYIYIFNYIHIIYIYISRIQLSRIPWFSDFPFNDVESHKMSWFHVFFSHDFPSSSGLSLSLQVIVETTTGSGSTTTTAVGGEAVDQVWFFGKQHQAAQCWAYIYIHMFGKFWWDRKNTVTIKLSVWVSQAFDRLLISWGISPVNSWLVCGVFSPRTTHGSSGWADQTRGGTITRVADYN